MNFGQKALDVLKAVAPTIATAVGGPLAGAATSILVKEFGGGDAKVADSTIAAADPQTLVQLQKVDNDFKAKMAELGVQEDQLAYADTASARNREEQVRDWTPSILAYFVTIGFFGILLWMLAKGVPREGGDVLLVMLGSLGAGWTAIMSYFFGASLGGRKNADALASIAKSPT